MVWYKFEEGEDSYYDGKKAVLRLKDLVDENMACYVINHELIHKIVHRLADWKACCQVDAIVLASMWYKDNERACDNIGHCPGCTAELWCLQCPQMDLMKERR